MPPATGRTIFQTAPEEQAFAPVYYLFGEENYLKDEAARGLIAAAVEPQTREFNLQQYKAGDLDAEVLDTLLSTPPMMAKRRVIVIHDVDTLRKEARATLDRYLDKPSFDIVLVLIATENTKADKRLVNTTKALEYHELAGARLDEWIVRRAEALDAQITSTAVRLLQNIAGSELSRLSIELEKLANYADDGLITDENVVWVVGKREETLSALLDAVAEKNATAAQAAVLPALRQPKASAVVIVMTLTVQTLALAWGEASGLRGARLTSQYWELLKKSGSLFIGRAWGEAIPVWTKTVSLWSARELTDALNALSRADLTLKDTGVSSEEQVLSTLILTICYGREYQSGA